MQSQTTNWNVVPTGAVSQSPSGIWDSPGEPDWITGSISFNSSFPVTVFDSTVPAIPNGTEYASWSAVKTAVEGMGGNIAIRLPAGGTYPFSGGWSTNVAIIAPVGADKAPSVYFEQTGGSGEGIQTAPSWSDGNGKFFVKGIACGPPVSQIDQDQAWGFNSGGTYQILVGDTVTGASSGTTAKVLKVFLDSGAWASETATGRLVLHERFGTFSAENLNVGANLNVATLTDNVVEYGPRTKGGNSAFYHGAEGKMTLVSCKGFNTNWNGFYCVGSLDSISGATSQLEIFDCEADYCADSTGEHNFYLHNSRVSGARNVSKNTAGNHEWKCETYRAAIYQSAFLHDSGSLVGIAEEVITAASGTQSVALDGYLASGGTVTFTSGKELIRVMCIGNCTGRWLVFTGTDPSDNPITERIRGGNNAPVWTALRFKTLTAMDIEFISGGTGQTLYVGHGIATPSQNSGCFNFSRAQNSRYGLCYVQQRSFETTGGQVIFGSARTGKYGGWSPNITPPFSGVDNDIGDTDFWASNLYVQGDTEVQWGGLVSGAHAATATSLAVKNISRAMQVAPNITLTGGVSYTVRVLRTDNTVLEFDAIPSATGSATATFPIGGQLGGGGAASNRRVAIKRTADGWDLMQVASRWGNQADPEYMFAKDTARGIRATDGSLDVANKQANFDKAYFEDCMVSVDSDTPKSVFELEPSGQMTRWSTSGTFDTVVPLVPFNRPAGPYSLDYTSGGAYQVARGDTITGATSGATGVVGGVKLTSGTFGAETAAGTFYLTSKTGNFVAENLNVGANLNVATIAGNAVEDWPDDATAATIREPLTGDANCCWGTQPVGFVSRDDLGPNCDWVWPWPMFVFNIGIHKSTRSGVMRHFAPLADPVPPMNISPLPDYRYIATSGTLTSVDQATNTSPLNESISTETNGAHSASATKIYVVSTAGISAGMRAHIRLKPHLPGFDQMYAGPIENVGSDGGGAFITIGTGTHGTAGLQRAIATRAEVAAFTPGGSPPSYFVRPDNYLTS